MSRATLVGITRLKGRRSEHPPHMKNADGEVGKLGRAD